MILSGNKMTPFVRFTHRPAGQLSKHFESEINELKRPTSLGPYELTSKYMRQTHCVVFFFFPAEFEVLISFALTLLSNKEKNETLTSDEAWKSFRPRISDGCASIKMFGYFAKT